MEPIIRAISTTPITIIDQPAQAAVMDGENVIEEAIAEVSHLEYVVEASFAYLDHELYHRFHIRDFTDKEHILNRLNEEFEKYKRDIEKAKEITDAKLPDDVASLIVPK